MPALQDAWDEGRARKGRVTSLPYEREEIERVLATYEDAEGHVRLKNVRTKFRRCACVDADGKRDVCVPPEAGWMCARTATLFKMHVVLQREKIEKDRASRERLSIEQAIEQARARKPTSERTVQTGLSTSLYVWIILRVGGDSCPGFFKLRSIECSWKKSPIA